MDKRQLLKILKEQGRYISPDGVVDITWLFDEGRGFIDIKNPNDVYKFGALKKKATAIIDNLPHGTWEFNPDNPKKGNIYKKMFPNARVNPAMPNNALILETKPKLAQKIVGVTPAGKAARVLGISPFLGGVAKAADIYVFGESSAQFKKNPNLKTGIQAGIDAVGLVDPTPISALAGLAWSEHVNRARQLKIYNYY
jgi:hypothetical protein